MKKENVGGKEGKRVGRREKERGKKGSFAATLFGAWAKEEAKMPLGHCLSIYRRLTISYISSANQCCVQNHKDTQQIIQNPILFVFL